MNHDETMTNHDETMTENHHKPWQNMNHDKTSRTMKKHHEPWRNITNHDKTSRTMTKHHEPWQNITNHDKTWTMMKHHEPWQNITNHHEPPQSLIQNEIWYWILDSDWLNSGSHDIFLRILEKNYPEPSRTTTKHHESSWTTTKHHETSETTRKHDKSSQTTMKHHESPQIFTNHHETSANCHEISWIIMTLPQNIMNHYEPPHVLTKTAFFGQYLSELLEGFAQNLHKAKRVNFLRRSEWGVTTPCFNLNCTFRSISQWILDGTTTNHHKPWHGPLYKWWHESPQITNHYIITTNHDINHHEPWKKPAQSMTWITYKSPQTMTWTIMMTQKDALHKAIWLRLFNFDWLLHRMTMYAFYAQFREWNGWKE